MTAPTWPQVLARYRPGDTLAPVAGSSRIVVAAVDDDGIEFRQRLWQDRIGHAEYTTAVELLLRGGGATTPVGFSERVRVHYSGGPQVTTGCSRVPTLCAVLLADLGLLAPPP